MSQMKSPLVLMALAFPLLKAPLFGVITEEMAANRGYCTHLDVSEVDN